MALRSRSSRPPSNRIRSSRVSRSPRNPAYTVAATIAPMIPPHRAAATSTPPPRTRPLPAGAVYRTGLATGGLGVRPLGPSVAQGRPVDLGDLGGAHVPGVAAAPASRGRRPALLSGSA